jgi:hypothetical protein
MEANTNNAKQPRFESWCLVELFGYSQIAGFVTEATIAGGAFIRVDVPNPQGEGDLYTRYFGPSAIYAINPTTKEEVLQIVSLLTPKPPTPRRYERKQLSAHNDHLYDDPEGEQEDDEDFPDIDDKPDANHGEIGF